MFYNTCLHKNSYSNIKKVKYKVIKNLKKFSLQLGIQMLSEHMEYGKIN